MFQHFHEKIVIEKMAEQLGTSASYLGMIFRKSEHMTLHQFIMSEKVERGKTFCAIRTTTCKRLANILALPPKVILAKSLKNTLVLHRQIIVLGKTRYIAKNTTKLILNIQKQIGGRNT